MATTSLKWAARKGAPPKKYGYTPMSSENEIPNPNAKDTPSFFTIKHYKWFVQYQQLFQFYLVHGHTNVTRGNDNSLSEWASYQRSEMGEVVKYELKCKHLLNIIGFCCSPNHPPTPKPRPSMELQRKLTARISMTGETIGYNRVKTLQGGSSKIKDHDWQNIYDVYSVGIFSGILFEMQNGLPSRMYEEQCQPPRVYLKASRLKLQKTPATMK
jgi:hypothetical protein